MTQGQNRARVGRLILFATLWLVLFILSVKVSAALVTRSLSLIAESLHTLLAGYSTLLSLLAVTVPNPSKGRSIQGHGKRETILTFLLFAFFGFVGLNLVIFSSQQLAVVLRGEILAFPVSVSLSLILLLGILIVSGLAFAAVGFYQAKTLGNVAVRFIASQIFRDTLLTILVLGGLLAAWWGLVWLDALLAILLVLLAVASCWQVVSWQLPFLVQQSAIAPEAIAQITRQVGGVTHCYHIRSRGLVGRFVDVRMRLIVHPEFTQSAPLITARIENAIQKRFGPARVTLYVDDDDVTKLSALKLSPSKPEDNGENYFTQETN